MPYTPTSPLIVFCDALVAYIAGRWEPKYPSAVSRAHRGQGVDLKTLAGRQVRVVPLGYTSVAASRGQDFYSYRIGVLTVEKYTPAADPDEVIPTEWIDERVDWVHTEIYKALDFARDGTQPSINKDVQTLSSPVEDVYDPETLEQDKAFWSWIEFEIQELEAI